MEVTRDAIDSIKTLYDLYSGELRWQTANEESCSSSTTQSSPWMSNQEGKRRQEETVEIPETQRRTPNPVPRVLAKNTARATFSRQVDT